MGRRKLQRARQRAMSPNKTEWLGGTFPFPTRDDDDPVVSLQLMVWLELPSGLLVYLQPFERGSAPSLGQALQAAIQRPAAGPPRRPRRVRVATQALAQQVRDAGLDIDIMVAPTPELLAVLHDMGRSMRGGGGQEPEYRYLSNPDVDPSAVAALFDAAKSLWRAAPWKETADSELLRVDVPALGVQGAAACVIGALGEALGLAFFDSLEDYDAFGASAETHRDGRPMDLGASNLALHFEKGSDLYTSTRKEIASHGWPVAAPAAYPILVRTARDATIMELTPEDLAFGTAATRAVTRFFERHPKLSAFRGGAGWEESFDLGGEIIATVAFPYVRGPAAGLPPVRPLSEVHAQHLQLERSLSNAMLAFANERFGDGWSDEVDSIADDPNAQSILVPWSLYDFPVGKQPVVDWFLEANPELSADERAWLQAGRAAWLSVWEVLSVKPGASITLRDRLTGEQRTVAETQASTLLDVRVNVLARVTDFKGLSTLHGIHLWPLPPSHAAQVLAGAKTRLRRKSEVPVSRVAEPKFGAHLLKLWEAQVAVMEASKRTGSELGGNGPVLVNQHAHPYLLTEDHFTFARGARDQILEALDSLEGARPDTSSETEDRIDFLLDLPRTNVFADLQKAKINAQAVDEIFTQTGVDPHRQWIVGGTAIVGAGSLVLRTNSIQRADALRQRVQSACKRWLTHKAREHTDPTSAAVRAEFAQSRGKPAAPTSDVEAALLLQFKAEHYRTWPDIPLPSLQGLTPRAAVRRGAGRKMVDDLLREMEYLEQHAPAGQRFDVGILRRDLGLDE